MNAPNYSPEFAESIGSLILQILLLPTTIPALLSPSPASDYIIVKLYMVDLCHLSDCSKAADLSGKSG